MAEKQWFETWFDSPYYHTLYDHRDFAEADTFINNINEHFKFNIFDQKKLIKKLKLDINDFSTTDLKIIYKNLYLNKK